MKLMASRDQDRTHLREIIGVGLIIDTRVSEFVLIWDDVRLE
jgi:hypothetical protein